MCTVGETGQSNNEGATSLCFSMENKTNTDAMIELFKVIISVVWNKSIGKYFISLCTMVWDNSIKLHLDVQDRCHSFVTEF